MSNNASREAPTRPADAVGTHPHLNTPLPPARDSAVYSEDFFKQILPIMYDASILDQGRFMKLVVSACVPPQHAQG